jgi:hypothetical protein
VKHATPAAELNLAENREVPRKTLPPEVDIKVMARLFVGSFSPAGSSFASSTAERHPPTTPTSSYDELRLGSRRLRSAGGTGRPARAASRAAVLLVAAPRETDVSSSAAGASSPR